MPTFDKILCPTDFSEAADAALVKARELALACSATLILAHVIDEGSYFLEATGQRGPWTYEDYEQKARERLVRQAERLGVPAQVRVERGRPAETLSALAQAEGASLIVLGSHARTALGRAFAGSVTERIVRTCPIPALVVRST